MQSGLHHPDFVVMLGGNDLTKDCLSWKVIDSEEQKSSIEVELDNLDFKWSPKITLGEKVGIRFGLMGGQFTPKIEMMLLKYQEKFDKSGMTVKLYGLDDTHKLDSQVARGQQKGKDVKVNAEKVAQSGEIKVEHGDEKPPTLEGDQEEPCARTPVKAGTTARQHIEGQKNQCSTGEGESISGQEDDKTEGAKTGDGDTKTEQRATASGIQPGKDGKRDKNRLENARKRADSKTIKGKVLMLGYPMVFAKACITIENAGPHASGKWYVYEAQNSWSSKKGYTTELELLRDTIKKDDEGKGKESQPMVFHANITKPGTAYSGPRKIDAPSQATFTWGDGSYIKHFEWTIDLYTNKGQRKKATGKTVNPEMPKKPQEEQKSPEQDEEKPPTLEGDGK